MHSRILLATIVVAGCATVPSPGPRPADEPATLGVLVMAHGSSDEWNAAVHDAVERLGSIVPTTVAFGMADPVTMTRALRELEQRGIERVVVVRLFLSGASFRHQTEYLLGVRADPPEWLAVQEDAGEAAAELISHHLEIATHQDGLSDSPIVAEIIADRVRAASRDPSREAILLIGHGAGDDIEDARWLDRMQEATTALDGTYRAIEVATLREDWPEKRTVAEAEIRAFVSGRSDAGLRVIVVPFRLYGEGPYRDVLGELDFTMTPALAPHGAVEEWILATAKRISCAEGWDSPLGSCGTDAAQPVSSAVLSR